MKLNFNMSAIISCNQLSNSDNALAKSLERLSSGYKINHAKDDPAGLAISRKMRAQISGLSTASDIATNGTSVIETAEGTLSEMQSMVARMKELSVQASNGTSTTADRNAIQSEVVQLSKEIERLAKDTEFNGQSLLNGNFDLKGYTDNLEVKVGYYSDNTYAKDYTLEIVTKAASGATTVPVDPPQIILGAEFPSGATATAKGNQITIEGPNDFLIKVNVSDNYESSVSMVGGLAVVDSKVNLDITGLGAMTFQIGSNAGQNLDVRIPEISLENMNIQDLDFTTENSAKEAMERLDDATAFISEVRSRLGAYQNRFEHAISSLDITEENMTEADSRIMDVDMASEMSEYTKYQVLTQADISMLSQANERPEKVLQLLQ